MTDPTEAQIKAGANALWSRLDLNGHTLGGAQEAARGCFAAMQAAAPPPPDDPEPPKDDEDEYGPDREETDDR